MAFLGPDGAGPPPAKLCDELIQRVSEQTRHKPVEEKVKWAVQLTLAYGCKWGRDILSHNSRWDDYWPGARQEITEIAYNFVIEAFNELDNLVVDFNPNWDEARNDADLAARDFIELRVYEAEPKYKGFQTISNWDPQKGSLYGWLKQAIFGRKDKGRQFQTNHFREGLLYKYLSLGQRVIVAKVAFQICPECRDEKGEYRAREYDGRSCSECGGQPFISFKVLLVVPGVYVKWSFLKCTNKGYFKGYAWHHYDVDRSRCPHCGEQPPQTATTLLVRRNIAEAIVVAGVESGFKQALGPRARLRPGRRDEGV